MAGPLLLITPAIEGSPRGGRALLSRLNHDALREILGDDVIVLEVGGERSGVFRALAGEIDGVGPASIEAALRVVRERVVGRVFLDGSNLGEMARAIKRRAPEVEVMTFFHNVEARFFAGALRRSPTPHAGGVLAANYVAERKAVRWSDRRICLSERDSQNLRRLYGRAATDVSPIAVRDLARPDGSTAPPEPHALFVGGTFYANVDGIRWFARHVAPRAAIETWVVGKGFEAYCEELEIPGKLRVVGAVDDLAQWYERAAFAIAPIFDGSGMKTKVAEALMFGKRVVGTPDAFAGYDDAARSVGWVASDPDGFVAAMDHAAASASVRSDALARSIYEKTYSPAAQRARLASILAKPSPAGTL